MSSQSPNQKKPLFGKFIYENWEWLGIVMISCGLFYAGFSLLVWHGWIWISLKPPYSIFTFETLTMEQLSKMLWLNNVAFALFALSLCIFVLGIIIYNFGEKVKVTS